MSERYKDSDVLELMNKVVFLDPRFKTLAHLPASTVEDITTSIQREMVNLLQQNSPEDQPSKSVTTEVNEQSPPQKNSSLEKAPG